MKAIVHVWVVISAGVLWAAPVRWPGNGHMYEAVYVPEGISWTSAEAAAERAGGHLATITSAEENQFVFSLVDDPKYWQAYEPTPAYHNHGPWIGGFQLPGSVEPAGGWTWVTGEPFTFAAWFPGEPTGTWADRNEDRLHFFCDLGVRVATWNDTIDQPSRSILGSVPILGYVIEYETYKSEPVRWSGNGHLYQAVATAKPITWTQARQAAEEAGGYLATITSPGEDNFVFHLIDDDMYWQFTTSNIGPWIGGFQPEGSAEPAGGWSWVTGEAFSYANWDRGVPDNQDGSQGCLHFGWTAPRNGKWNDLEEDGRGWVRAYVIEYETYKSEPVRWSGNGHLYQAVATAEPITWSQALQAANEAGGYLATITSAGENEFVFSLIDSDPYWFVGTDSYLHGPWIGGLQPVGSPEPAGGWSWVTGELFVYANWDGSQPNNKGNEDRIHFGFSVFRTQAWNDVSENYAEINAYVIEYETYKSKVVQWPGNGHLYQAIATAEPITWTQARQAAEEAGGYLATITSPEENAYVHSLIDNDLYWNGPSGPWIGGYQPEGSPEPGGGWRWVTDEPFVYTNWDSSQPNNQGNQESYLQFGYHDRTSGWNDNDNTGTLGDYAPIVGYVIEYEVRKFDFPTFNNTNQLHLCGSATLTNGLLQLTAAEYWVVGGAWYALPVDVQDGFETTFDFRIGRDGADGFAFVIQNAGSTVLGTRGAESGYNIPNSIAVEFDTWRNVDDGDLNANHVSIQTRGIERNGPEHSYSLGSTTLIPFLSDNRPHQARIAYVPGQLCIFVDDLERSALTVQVELEKILTLSDGCAFVGFTAATGGDFETHDILRWSFASAAAPDGAANGNGGAQ